MRTLEQRYTDACEIPSDIREHCPMLRQLATRSSTVGELGQRYGVSTTALLAGRPVKLVSVDIRDHGTAGILQKIPDLSTEYQFILGSSLDVDIPNCTTLFIDTLHTYAQLSAELKRHAGKVWPWIALHDTHTFGRAGEVGGPGVLPAIKEFLAAHREWREVYQTSVCNGLTVLMRMKPPSFFDSPLFPKNEI